MSISLDGYFEGPDHDISWHHVDDEFNDFAISQLRETAITCYGRRTYELMESYWPKAAEDPSTSEQDREIARLINEGRKIVFSRTLQTVNERKNWKDVTLHHEIDPDLIRLMKNETDRNIGVGGSELATSFVMHGLLDELRLMVNPIILGKGTPLLKGLEGRLDLELIRTRNFSSGNVLLCYRPVHKRS
ncbi:MAG: hypothetical protein A4E32_01538 [Methanomassiliicoccales archaeon PtaU1.Bin124]|nr:MAG: hypothetical protein A4E32_01538 [Methanomassiliicoccales archaeon PtaU1.Bin124]